MKTIKIIMLLLLIVIISCNKSDNSNIFTPTLPPITQTGENTFGCYIDGQLVTPRDRSELITGIIKGMKFVTSGNAQEIRFKEIQILDGKSDNRGALTIHISDLEQNGDGNFLIKESNCNDGFDAIDSINIFCSIWHKNTPENFITYCSIEDSGTLTISRYDYDNKIVSGTFSFSAVNQDNPNDIIEITEGRFDINWGTLTDTEFP